MENKNIRVCWGTPDTVHYIDGNNQEHEIDYSPYGYTFGIWDGVCITSSDNDETCGLMHDDLMPYYIWENGWPAQGILSPKEAYGSDVDWDTLDELKVRYDDEDEDVREVKSVLYQHDKDEDRYNLKITWADGDEEEFEDQGEDDVSYYLDLSEDVSDDIIYDSGEDMGDGWKKLEYELRDRPTYEELIYSLGSPTLRGRILMDFDVDTFNPPSFIAFWNEDDVTPENIKELADEWGRGVYDYIMVTETNEQSATKYGIFNMPTLREWLNGETAYKGEGNSDEKNRLFNIHLGNQEQKNKFFQDFKDFRGELQGKKLGNMPMAKYHNLIHSESKKSLNKIITESIQKYLKKHVSKII